MLYLYLQLVVCPTILGQLRLPRLVLALIQALVRRRLAWLLRLLPHDQCALHVRGALLWITREQVIGTELPRTGAS